MTTQAKQKQENQNNQKKETAATVVVEKAVAEKALGVDESEYEQFCELKFMELDGAKFKEDIKKTIQKLEDKLKSCKGLKPKKTVTASINMETVRLVKDIPVPASVMRKIGEKNISYYF